MCAQYTYSIAGFINKYPFTSSYINSIFFLHNHGLWIMDHFVRTNLSVWTLATTKCWKLVEDKLENSFILISLPLSLLDNLTDWGLQYKPPSVADSRKCPSRWAWALKTSSSRWHMHIPCANHKEYSWLMKCRLMPS